MGRNQLNKRLLQSQTGAATLFVVIILLVGVTLIALYAARVGVLDQRISGNEYRHKEAFANAEAGLEQAASFLQANPEIHTGTAGWASCAGLTTIPPCNITDADSVYATVSGSTITTSVQTISTLTESQSYLVKKGDNTIAVGIGSTLDGTGSATAMVEYAEISLLTPGAIPPLMAPEIDLSGNFTIVPNPNGGGPGVPLSAWAASTVTSSGYGSWQTCNHGDFQNGSGGNFGDICMDALDDSVTWKDCGCYAGKEISVAGPPTVIGDDIIQSDPSFPASPFEYFFNGLSPETVREDIVRAADPNAVIANCGGLNNTVFNALNSSIVWVEGDCNIPTIIGSRDKPIILIVEGLAKADGNVDVWGVLLGLDQVTLNGTTTIHGSVISEQATKLTTGGYSQVYDESVFAELEVDVLDTLFAKVKYSWRDF
jgi:Tfp pilus assembly protein PilX